MENEKTSLNHLILKYLKVHHEELGESSPKMSPKTGLEKGMFPYGQFEEEEEEEEFDQYHDDLFHFIPRAVQEKADYTEMYKKVYEDTRKNEHQYPLFDLVDIIPGFQLDDKTSKKLRFRESLLVSDVDESGSVNSMDSTGFKPKTVGGLCLDVQFATGYQPTKRKKPTDEDFDQQLEEVLVRIKEEIAHETEEGKAMEDEKLKEKLRKYKELLITQRQKEQRKFLIHLSSTFEVNGQKAGSTIISWVDNNLHTLEERRKEYICNEDDIVYEKVLYFGMQNKKYYIKASSTVPKSEERKYYSLVKTKDLVGEGANFVLMRYLAITKYVGIFELSTVYINGDMCRNIYECQGPTSTTINGKKIDVCKIYRSIIEQCGVIHNCVTILTVTGKIVNQEWEGCSYILRLNPLIVFEDTHLCKYEKMDLKRVWDSDMELMSKYLDCKTQAELKMKTYMSDHPEINEMISDYVQTAILLKPDNVLSFTMEYFHNFDPYDVLKKVFSESMIEEDDPFDIDTYYEK